MSEGSWTELLKDDVTLEEVQELVRTGEFDVKEPIVMGTTFFTKFVL